MRRQSISDLPEEVREYLQESGPNKGCLVIPGKNVFPCIYLRLNARKASTIVMVGQAIRAAGLYAEYGEFEINTESVRCWGTDNFAKALHSVMQTMNRAAFNAGLVLSVGRQLARDGIVGYGGSVTINLSVSVSPVKSVNDDPYAFSGQSMFYFCESVMNSASALAEMAAIKNYSADRITNKTSFAPRTVFRIGIPIVFGVDANSILQRSQIDFTWLGYDGNKAVIQTDTDAVRVQHIMDAAVPNWGCQCFVLAEDYAAYIASGKELCFGQNGVN